MILAREMKRTIWILTGRDWFKDEPEMEIHYIGGTEVLPPPLDGEKENEMLEALCTEKKEWAKSILIEHNLRLVVYIAKRFDNTGVGVEDLISIGTIGLIKAINTYRSDKNIKLATYASRCIENEILMYLRRTSKNKLEVSIDEPLNTDFDGNELLLSDILGTEEDLIYKDLETQAECNMLYRSISRLSPREKTIICLRFGIRPEHVKSSEPVKKAGEKMSRQENTGKKNIPKETMEVLKISEIGRELQEEMESEACNFTALEKLPVQAGKELTQKEVATLLGISQSYISRLEKKIMKQLKKDMMRDF